MVNCGDEDRDFFELLQKRMTTLNFVHSYTVWLQISAVKYFRDFREFRYDHENFCYEIFLTAAYSTALDTLKSRKTSESRKSGKITKV